MVLPTLELDGLTVTWLNGGVFQLDAGAMFGVVPKVLWSRRFPATDDNHLVLANRPLLLVAGERVLVVDTGIGNKLSAKQRAIFRVTEPWRLEESLAAAGVDRFQVTDVILTHGDFDHAGGVTMAAAGGEVELTFPRARHYLNRREWEDIRAPNRRSAASYWPVNFQGLAAGDNLVLVEDELEVVPGVRLVHTGGHTRGHQAVWLGRPGGRRALHLGDLLPNQAHTNPLWVTPYDNFPLDSVAQKERLLAAATAEDAWLTLYHDPYVAAIRLADDGTIRQGLAGEPYVPPPA